MYRFIFVKCASFRINFTAISHILRRLHFRSSSVFTHAFIYIKSERSNINVLNIAQELSKYIFYLSAHHSSMRTEHFENIFA